MAAKKTETASKESGAKVPAAAKKEEAAKPVAIQKAPLLGKSLEGRLEDVEHMLDRMFERFLPSGWRPFRFEWPSFPELPELRTPAMNVVDRENDILVRAELPGVSKDDISVSLTSDSVSVEAKSKKEEETKEKGQYRRKEIRAQAYARSLWLPGEIDPEAATAKFKDGVLKLTLPKTGASKRRTLKIQEG